MLEIVQKCTHKTSVFGSHKSSPEAFKLNAVDAALGFIEAELPLVVERLLGAPPFEATAAAITDGRAALMFLGANGGLGRAAVEALGRDAIEVPVSFLSASSF